MFDRLKHLRDMPLQGYSSLETFIQTRINPESYFDKKERMDREEEEKKDYERELYLNIPSREEISN